MSQSDLEAAIESSPDDPGAYAVYADWLQAKDDPRGELIALQTAAWRAPSDKKLARAASQHLRIHRASFVPFDDDAIDASWHCGFLRAIRFRHDSRELVGTLQAIVGHPSGRFLQSIAMPNDVDAEPIVELLLEERKPATLVELRARAAIVQRHVEALQETFPRFGAGLAPDWRRVLLAIRDERKIDLKYYVDGLPHLEAIAGIDVADLQPEDVARGLKLEIGGTRQMELVSAIRRSFTADSRDRFAIALAEQFFQAETTPTRRWAFDALAEIGDAGAARWLRAQLGRWSVPRAQQGIAMLALLAKRTPTAVSVLLALANDGRIAGELRAEVSVKLGDIAAHRGVDLAGLARDLPTLADEPLPNEILRGTRVAWTNGKRTRTGTVFWIGKAKRGDGIRVGIREDETEETLWANQADCQPV